MRSVTFGKIWLLAIVMLLAFSVNIGKVSARDVRLALLVGNQWGWKGDPYLRYALKGDLRPLAQTLRRIGFEVRVLKNKKPSDLRKILKKIQRRVVQWPRVTTFLFYYSGHSDRNALHMGPDKRRAVRYQELVSFFKDLKVDRRFVILDSCFSGEIIRKFGSLHRYKELIRKGARARRFIDLGKEIANQGSDTRSLQVLSSGLAVTWESKRYKASIFTHHLLQGLRGKADRDHDGKISIEEVFDFVSLRMMRDTQEQPRLFGVVNRSNAYALAPAYNSHLWIDAGITGQLKVSVANFIWSWQKRRLRPLRLALVHGRGTVHLKRGKLCWQQDVVFPKGREARLHRRWRSVLCSGFARQPKGSIKLSSEVTVVPQSSSWNLEGYGGLSGSNLLSSGYFGGGRIGLRRRWFGISLGLMTTSSSWEQKSYRHLLIDALFEVGFRRNWGDFDLFAGGHIGLGLFLQDVNQDTAGGVTVLYGLSFKPTWWFTDRWGSSLRLQAGFMVGEFGGQNINRFSWSVMAGFVFRM